MAAVRVPEANVRKKPPRPPPPKNLPEHYHFCKLGSSFSPTTSPEKRLAHEVCSLRWAPSTPAATSSPYSRRKGSAPVAGVVPPRPNPVPLPRHPRRNKSDVGVVSAPVAKPRQQHPVPKVRVAGSPAIPPRPPCRATPPCPIARPRTTTLTRDQPVAGQDHSSHSLSASVPPAQPMTKKLHNGLSSSVTSLSEPVISRASSMPRLAIAATRPNQPIRKQPPRPPVGPRLSQGVPSVLRAADQTTQTFNTLPKPSKVDNHRVPPAHHERDRPVSDSVEDNIYSAITDASLTSSAEDLQTAPLYSVPDETGVYAGLIDATKDQGDSNYVSLGRIPPDQQLEMEEGDDLYTIPDANAMYMAIDPHTMQVDSPYQKPSLIVNPANH